MKQLIRLAVLLCFVLPLGTSAIAAEPDDSFALQGIEHGKALFDINLKEAEPLTLYLQVIRETWEGLLAQGVQPEFVVAFRGLAVTLVSEDPSLIPPEKAPVYAMNAQLISELADLGVRFEACAVATRIFGVDNDSILPSIEVVGNTFISSIGYQSKRNGYALFPIQ